MRFRIESTQAHRAARAMENAATALYPDILAAIRDSARDVAQTTRRLLRAKRGGSRAGEPPGRVTGLLAKSIRYRQVRSRSRGRLLAYTVFHARDSFYGKFLETGTGERRTAHKRGRANRGRVDPRPFLTAAQEMREDKTAARIGAAIRRSLDRASR